MSRQVFLIVSGESPSLDAISASDSFNSAPSRTRLLRGREEQSGCDVNNMSLESAGITETSTGVSPAEPLHRSDSRNAADVFTFLNQGGWHLLLSTSGYAPGSYTLNFS